VLDLVIAWAIHKAMGFRITAEAEYDGIDDAEHAESAYDLGAYQGPRARVGGLPGGGS
jgi:Amt family ammonium transporter